MVGRAGRLGFSDKGASYAIAANGRAEYDVWQRFVLGRPEDVRSRLFDRGSDPRNLVLRTLAASAQVTVVSAGMAADEIVAFIEDSFGPFSSGKRPRPGSGGGRTWGRP